METSILELVREHLLDKKIAAKKLKITIKELEQKIKQGTPTKDDEE